MIVAMTGGRDRRPPAEELAALLEKLDQVGATEFHHGAARGTDRLAARHVMRERPAISVVAWPVVEELDGPWPWAGKARNRRMLRGSGARLLVAFRGAGGTADCVTAAEEMGLEVFRVG